MTIKQKLVEAVERIVKKFEGDLTKHERCKKCKEEMPLMVKYGPRDACIYFFCERCEIVLIVDYIHKDLKFKSVLEQK